MKRIIVACIVAVSLPLYGQTSTINEYAKLDPHAQFMHTNDGITIYVKQYPLIKHETVQFTKKGNKRIKHSDDASFYPVELSIENNSTASLILDPATIDLSMMNTQEVAQLLSNKHTLQALQAVSLYGGVPAGALILGGSAIACAFPCITVGFKYVLSIGITTAGTVAFLSIAGGIMLALGTLALGLPIAALTAKSLKAQALTLQGGITVKPGKSVSKLLLIREKDFKKDFSLAYQTSEKIKEEIPGKKRKKVSRKTETNTLQISLQNASTIA